MRTTIRIDDHLLAAAKARAARTGRTLTAVIEDALRKALAEEPAERSTSVRLPTFPGRLRPGVDLDDSAALLDLMDEHDQATDRAAG
jgi:hypothetical protein